VHGQLHRLAVVAGQHPRIDQPLAALAAQLYRDLGHIGLLPGPPDTEPPGAVDSEDPDGYAEHELEAALAED
jgi:hypothetical protein